HTEIHQTDVILGQHKKVPGVKVSVEQPVCEHHLQISFQSQANDLVRIVVFMFEGSLMTEGHAVQGLHGENPLRGQIQINFGDFDLRIVFKVFLKATEVVGLHHEVRLKFQSFKILVNNP